jgi:hypothetical protein
MIVTLVIAIIAVIIIAVEVRVRRGARGDAARSHAARILSGGRRLGYT